MTYFWSEKGWIKSQKKWIRWPSNCRLFFFKYCLLSFPNFLSVANCLEVRKGRLFPHFVLWSNSLSKGNNSLILLLSTTSFAVCRMTIMVNFLSNWVLPNKRFLFTPRSEWFYHTACTACNLTDWKANWNQVGVFRAWPYLGCKLIRSGLQKHSKQTFYTLYDEQYKPGNQWRTDWGT